RERGVRRLSALPHLGHAAGRRLRWPRADKLGPFARNVGRGAAAKPVRAHVPSRHERARQPSMGGDADDRGFGQPGQVGGRESGQGADAGAGFRGRGLQGGGADAAPVEPAASPADPLDRRAEHGLGLAPGGFPAPGLGTRYAGLRSAGDQMQARLTLCVFALAASALWPAPGFANTAFVSNEKGNSISVIDTATLEVKRTVKVGQRPRGIALSKDDSELFVCLGDDDTIQVIDTKTMAVAGELPSGPDPEQLRVSPDGTLVFVANENDALLTAIDVKTRQVVTQFPVGVEPEGVAVSPDGAMVVNTSETTSMAHLIDWSAKKIVANILVPPRPRFAEFKPDGSELWVSSEVGG